MKKLMLVLGTVALWGTALFAGVPLASAEGVTAWTCVSGGSEGAGTKFSDPDCSAPSASGTYGHKSIPEGEETGVAAVATTTWVIGAELFGVEVLLTGTEVECVNCMWHNHEDESGSMEVVGNGGRLRITNVTTNLPNCAIQQPGEPLGTVTSEPLRFTITSAESATVAPLTGTLMAVIHLVNRPGSTCVLAGNYPIEGSVTAIPEGAHIAVTRASSELTIIEEPAFLEGEATLTAGPTSEPFLPVSLTEA